MIEIHKTINSLTLEELEQIITGFGLVFEREGNTKSTWIGPVFLTSFKFKSRLGSHLKTTALMEKFDTIESTKKFKIILTSKIENILDSLHVYTITDTPVDGNDMLKEINFKDAHMPKVGNNGNMKTHTKRHIGELREIIQRLCIICDTDPESDEFKGMIITNQLT